MGVGGQETGGYATRGRALYKQQVPGGLCDVGGGGADEKDNSALGRALSKYQVSGGLCNVGGGGAEKGGDDARDCAHAESACGQGKPSPCTLETQTYNVTLNESLNSGP